MKQDVQSGVYYLPRKFLYYLAGLWVRPMQPALFNVFGRPIWVRPMQPALFNISCAKYYEKLSSTTDNTRVERRIWSSTSSMTPAAARCRINASTPPTDDVTAVSRRVLSAPNFLAGTCNSYRVTSSTACPPVRPRSSTQTPSSLGIERNPSVLELRRNYSDSLRHCQTLTDNKGGLKSSSKYWNKNISHFSL